MRMWTQQLVLVTLVLLLGACGKSILNCEGAFEHGLYQCRMNFDEEKRYYQVRVPQSYTGEPIPLLIDLHGAGSPRLGNLSGERLVSGAEQKAEKEGFAVVWPDGVGLVWSTRRPKDYSSVSRDDVGFIMAMLEKLKTNINIDESRIYLMGISNGGAMSQVLACEHPEVFAAVASVAMQIPNNVVDCEFETKVPFISLHAPTDSLVPWEGFFGGTSAPESFDIWSSINQCTDEPVTYFTQRESSCVRRTECNQGTEVAFCNIDGKGYFLGGHLLYFNNGSINLMDLIWDHFYKFTR